MAGPAAERAAGCVPNCGAGRTCADPCFTTSLLRWLRWLIEPRGMPNPAVPAFRVTRDGCMEFVELIAAALPTYTVFTVPAGGGTRRVTWT